MIIRIFFAVFLLASFSSAQGLQFTKSLDCNWVDPIQTGFLQNHLVFKQKDSALHTRVVDQYIKRQDTPKIYLLESDVVKIKSIMKNVFEDVAKTDCNFLTEIQSMLVKRIEERTEFVKKLMGKDFKFNKDTEFVYDPEHKEYPKTAGEANEFIKKYVQFQVANYLATDIKPDEAKKRVIKNYERNLKRIKDTKNDALVANYLNSFALSLDPHSSFFSKEYYDDFTIDMSLSLEGIGATLSQEDGFTIVEGLVAGGAAWKSKLVEPQDKIVASVKKTEKWKMSSIWI